VRKALDAGGGRVKPAVILAMSDMTAVEADCLLCRHGGHRGPAIASLKRTQTPQGWRHLAGLKRTGTVRARERRMRTRKLGGAIIVSALVSGGAAAAQDVTLTIESWRNDDLTIWQDTIIPAFEAQNPGIRVVFAPSAPAEYNAVLNSKLEAGSAGDLITCRPFDASLALFEAGRLADLSDLPAMDNFSPVAKSAWQTDDGASTFCVPMASVIHGFIYNRDAFEELGLSVPATEEEFFALLDAIKADGSYIPMAMGVADQWEAATMGYQNIGPNYWKGEEGRLALIAGEQSLTDEAWVAPYETLARWGDYLGDGFEAQTYPDSQNLFTLGRAAIYPAGSWEISGFRQLADFEMGAFPPPVRAAGDTCYISDHTDIAIGLNAASPNAEAARTFLNWVGSAEFAALYSNALPGFFSLSNEPVTLEDPLAQEFVDWRGVCESTIRSTYQILSRGTPNLENETWTASANVIRGTETAGTAAERLQGGLASWYGPQQ
jgi:raffinose/stachyose/melibiose transport system substrate-binding protein